MSTKFYLNELAYLWKRSRVEINFLFLLFFLSGLFFTLYLSGYTYLANLRSKVYETAFCKVFLQEGVPDDYIVFLKDFFEKDPDVKDVRFVDKESALKEFKSRFPRYEELLKLFKENPLPINFELKFKNELLKRRSLEEKLEFFSQFPYVETVQSNYDFVLRLDRIINTLFFVAVFLFVFFTVIFIPILSSITRTILQKEFHLFELIELLGYDTQKAVWTIGIAAFVPAFIASLILAGITLIIDSVAPFSGKLLYAIPLFILFIQLLVLVDSTKP